MNTILWILQGLLSLVFLMSGIFKTVTPKKELEKKMPWAKDISSATIKFIGISELLGALGLILPKAFNFIPILTAIAAFSLALVMLLAISVHFRRKEFKEISINVILILIAIIIGTNRIN